MLELEAPIIVVSISPVLAYQHGVRKKQNLIEQDDRVEPVEPIAKSGSIVYSIDVAISCG